MGQSLPVLTCLALLAKPEFLYPRRGHALRNFSNQIGIGDQNGRLDLPKRKKDDIEYLKMIVSNKPPATQYHLFNIEHEIDFRGKMYEITGNNIMKKFQKRYYLFLTMCITAGRLKNSPC